VEAENLATGEKVTFDYDQLIIATGAQAVIPPIEGSKLGNIFLLRSPLDADGIIEVVKGQGIKRAAVIGAGLIGLEMVESFLALGMEVRVIELLEEILPMFDKDMAEIVRKHLEEKGVEVYVSEAAKSFESEDGKSVSRVITKNRTVEAGLALVSVGIRPNSEIAADAGLELGVAKAIHVNDKMETSMPAIYAAGDCAEVNNVVTGKQAYIPLGSTANKQGRVAAINATGGSETFGGVVGSVIAKVCELGVGKTGLTEAEAKEEGIDYAAVTIKAKDKAHYYPESETLNIKLLAERKTGRLLGAQIVGKAGVDKRIDVVATVLQGRGTVGDLAGLDLCYAPPYSMAIDAILVAAEVLQKKLD
jgi:NADPH-dependent 2,4-dienoyl-CoA reductase/sulfur reductase-like enzyme